MWVNTVLQAAQEIVAPLAGARIEIESIVYPACLHESPLSQGRELKLKLYANEKYGGYVAPLAGARIEIG